MYTHFYTALAVRANATEEMKMKINWNQEDGRITPQDSTAGSMGNVCSPETAELADGVLQNQHKGQRRQEKPQGKGLAAGTKPQSWRSVIGLQELMSTKRPPRHHLIGHY